MGALVVAAHVVLPVLGEVTVGEDRAQEPDGFASGQAPAQQPAHTAADRPARWSEESRTSRAATVGVLDEMHRSSSKTRYGSRTRSPRESSPAEKYLFP